METVCTPGVGGARSAAAEHDGRLRERDQAHASPCGPMVLTKEDWMEDRVMAYETPGVSGASVLVFTDSSDLHWEGCASQVPSEEFVRGTDIVSVRHEPLGSVSDAFKHTGSLTNCGQRKCLRDHLWATGIFVVGRFCRLLRPHKSVIYLPAERKKCAAVEDSCPTTAGMDHLSRVA